MTALERASQMMTTPMSELPSLARNFLAYSKPQCGEMMVTAFAIYAQIVEGCDCDDWLYQAKDSDRRWFEVNA